MAETSLGATVYADPDELRRYIQTDPDDLGKVVNDTADPDDPDDWDSLLAELQASAKARIDEFCQRDFELHEGTTVTLDGRSGTRMLRLPYPVREVRAVRVDGSLVDSGDYVWKESGSLIRERGGGQRAARYGGGRQPGLTTEPRPQWPAGYGNVEADLDWGYPDAPADIREAEVKLVDNTLSGLAQKREGTVVSSDDFDMEVRIPSAMSAEIRGMLRVRRPSEVFG